MATSRFRPKATRHRVDHADTLLLQILAIHLPEPMREFRFHPTRRWRFDLSWPARMIFAEVDGSEWTHGRHGRGLGMQSDCEKTNEAALLGWIGFRFTGSQVRSGYALTTLERALVTKQRTAATKEADCE